MNKPNFERLLMKSAESSLRTYANWVSGDKETLSKIDMPSEKVFQVLLADAIEANQSGHSLRIRLEVLNARLVGNASFAGSEQGRVDIVTYTTTQDQPKHLIEVKGNATPATLDADSEVLRQLLKSIGRPVLKGYQLAVLKGHKKEAAALGRLESLRDTGLRQSILERVVAFTDPSTHETFFVGLALFEVVPA